MALQKTNWRGSPTHRRTDSSDSSNASGGNSELSPGRECMDYEYQRSHIEHEGLLYLLLELVWRFHVLVLFKLFLLFVTICKNPVHLYCP